jgi:NAD(P)-dependent dehydrogenase (short-subunit alcohol dehydrogenase family)
VLSGVTKIARDGSMADSFSILARLFGLKGRVAVVAGGAGRIGRALCQGLSEAGAAVAVLDLDTAAAIEIASRISRQSARPVLAVTADITSEESLVQAAARIDKELGPTSILVNSAQFRGEGFYSSSPEDYGREPWEQVLRTNLTGVQLTCQAFGRVMKERGGGSIVNLASTYGVVSPDPRIYGSSGVNSPPAYGAAKAGVIQLTRYLAVHWRDCGIRVNCLVPGGVLDGQDQRFVSEYCRRTPLGRMAAPDDYIGPVIFMASAASAYMTGAVVTVDGGWTAW